VLLLDGELLLPVFEIELVFTVLWVKLVLEVGLVQPNIA